MLNSEVSSRARCSSQTPSLCLWQKYCLLVTSHPHSYSQSWLYFILELVGASLHYLLSVFSDKGFEPKLDVCTWFYYHVALKKISVPDWYNDWKIRVSEVWPWVCEPTYANSESASVTQLSLLNVWKTYVAWTATEILSSGETVVLTRGSPRGTMLLVLFEKNELFRSTWWFAYVQAHVPTIVRQHLYILFPVEANVCSHFVL